MAEEGAVPERAILHKAKGTFCIIKAEPRKLLNGNKLHVVIEADLDADLAQEMIPLFDKDCAVTFRELATQRSPKEKRSGQITFDGEVEDDEPIPPE